MKEECSSSREDAAAMREEAYSVLNKATQAREDIFDLREESFDLREEAGEIRDSVLEARTVFERTLVETLSDLKSHVTVSNIYIQEMRTVMSSLATKMEKLEERMGTVEDKIKTVETNINTVGETLGSELTRVAGNTDLITEKVEESVELVGVVKSRQQTLMSEVRLISYFKVTAQSHVRHDGYDSDLLVDGQFLFSRGNPANDQYEMRTYNSAPASENNHLYVELGGLFKISKIKIWNVRHCCQQRLVGTHVYADKVLVATVVRAQNTYIYEVEESVYARRVSLRQPLAQHLHILELQVWGSGPFTPGDIFV